MLTEFSSREYFDSRSISILDVVYDIVHSSGSLRYKVVQISYYSTKQMLSFDILKAFGQDST